MRISFQSFWNVGFWTLRKCDLCSRLEKPERFVDLWCQFTMQVVVGTISKDGVGYFTGSAWGLAQITRTATIPPTLRGAVTAGK